MGLRLPSVVILFNSTNCNYLSVYAMSDIDPQLHLLRRQYLQLFEPDFLAWPPSKFLKGPDVQKWLYKNLFDPTRNSRLPPEKYQMRILKQLVDKIEKATEDLDKDVSFSKLG